MEGPTTTGQAPVDDALDGLPEPGEVIANKYRIEEMIGRGGMGAVFRAQHELLLETVVLKLVLKGLDSDDNARSRFMREARASFQIKSEHVARVLDVDFLDSGKPFMVLEYLEGMDLAQHLRRRGTPLEPGQAVEYVLQSLDALAAAHALGIVHRDLKPANLFLVDTPDGRGKIKVLDFGIAKSTRTRDELTVTRIALGTPQYMSPEQLQDTRSVDSKADIWSIGVILFELLTGAHPFPGRDALTVYRAIRAKEAPLVTMLAPGVPAELAAVIARCLRAAPEERFADVGVLAQALAPFVLSTSPSNAIVQRIAEVLETPTTVITGGVDETADSALPAAPMPVAPDPVLAPGTLVMASVVPAAAAVAAPGSAAPPRRRSRWPVVAALLATVAIASIVAVRWPAKPSMPTPVASSPGATPSIEVAVAVAVPVVASAAPEPSASALPVEMHSATPRPKPRPPTTPRPRPTASAFDPTASRKL